MHIQHPLRRTTTLSMTALSFLLGIAFGHKWTSVPGVVLITGPLIVFFMWRYSAYLRMLVIILAVSFGFGWCRGVQIRNKQLGYEQLYGQQVTINVRALTDGVYATTTRNLSFDGGKVQIRSPTSSKLPGTIKLETIGLPAVFRGDWLEVSGKLYPARGSRQASLKFAQATLLERKISPIDRFRLRFAAGLQSSLPEPQASFALGILVGQRSTLPPLISDDLSRVGLTHIIAVSGYNLTIIINFLGKRFGRSKFQTLILSIGLIAGFILITGLSASIVRAGLVSILSLGAWYYGRALKPVLLILLTAAITAAWNPIYLWSDIGWYLSFLAFFGVLVVAPVCPKLINKDKQLPGVLSLLIETGAAQLMTMPLIMYIFGTVSVIALPANLLVVPLIPVAMLLSALAGLGAFWLPMFASWFAWPAKVLLAYLLYVAGIFAKLPYAVREWKMDWLAMGITYGLIMGGVAWAVRRNKPEYVRITDEDNPKELKFSYVRSLKMVNHKTPKRR